MVSWGGGGGDGGRGRIPQEILYAMQYQLKTCHRSEKKYKNKVISSHRLVNICAGNRSGLIRDRNQIEIRDFFYVFSLVFAQDCLLNDFVLSLTFPFIIFCFIFL